MFYHLIFLQEEKPTAAESHTSQIWMFVEKERCLSTETKQ
jgi:hypothetical protein